MKSEKKLREVDCTSCYWEGMCLQDDAPYECEAFSADDEEEITDGDLRQDFLSEWFSYIGYAEDGEEYLIENDF